MSENTDLSYYQKKRDVVLNKAKDYYKNNKDLGDRQEINTKTCLKKKKNMGKIDIVICLKKRKRN